MDLPPSFVLAGQLRGLRIGQGTEEQNPDERPFASSTASIQLIDDATCANCDGRGHWQETCDLLEHTRLSGRLLTSLARLPDSQLRFHLSLPWLALRSNRVLRSDGSSLQNPSNYGGAIVVILDFVSHLANYATFRWEQYRILDTMWHWLRANISPQASETTSPDSADHINQETNLDDIMRSWNNLAEETTNSLGELVSSLVNTIRNFEKSAIVVPIATEFCRVRLYNRPNGETVRHLQYSEIWEYICSCPLQQTLVQSLDQHQFQILLTAITRHRTTYMQRQVKVEQLFRQAVHRHQELREDPRAVTAFLMPKILAIQMDNAAVSGLRREDFAWPDRECLAARWARAMNDPNVVTLIRGDLDITRLFDTLSF